MDSTNRYFTFGAHALNDVLPMCIHLTEVSAEHDTEKPASAGQVSHYTCTTVGPCGPQQHAVHMFGLHNKTFCPMYARNICTI